MPGLVITPGFLPRGQNLHGKFKLSAVLRPLIALTAEAFLAMIIEH